MNSAAAEMIVAVTLYAKASAVLRGAEAVGMMVAGSSRAKPAASVRRVKAAVRRPPAERVKGATAAVRWAPAVSARMTAAV